MFIYINLCEAGLIYVNLCVTIDGRRVRQASRWTGIAVDRHRFG